MGSNVRRRCSLATGAVLIAGALAILSGCGGSSEGDGGSSDSKRERLANVKPSYDTSCPERKWTRTIRGSVFNAVPGSYSMKLSVPQDSYDCFDWSGISTPGRAFDGKSISRGYPEPFRLEADLRPYPYTPGGGGPWTMKVSMSPNRLGQGSNRFESLNGYAWCCNPNARQLPTTDWEDSSVHYVSVGDIEGMLREDSSAEAVKDACSKDPRAFGVGVYKGKLSWLFCYEAPRDL